MERKEQIIQAAHEYILSDAVKVGNENLAFVDFINGAKWADSNPNLTWEDIRKICIVAENVHKYYGFWSQSVYEAILNELNDPE